MLLLLVVLAPSVCLLWFMNQAVQNERLAVRQERLEACRGHLALAAERLDAYWQNTTRLLDAQAAALTPPALFAQLVRSNHCDSAICFESSNRILYPNPLPHPKLQPPPAALQQGQVLESTDPAAAAREYAQVAAHQTNTDLAAGAFQAEARCLVRSGQKEAALAVILGPLAESRFHNARDLQGRLLVPNVQLMALELLKDTNPARAKQTLQALSARLNNYDDPELSSAQRLFLFRELATLFPQEADSRMLKAEDLAARYLDAAPAVSLASGVRPTPLPGVLALSFSSGRVLALYETPKLLAQMRQAVAGEGFLPEVNLAVIPPGDDSQKAFLSLPAGDSLPGWRVAFFLKDSGGFDTTANHRITFYLWLGAMVVAVVVIMGFLALGLVRRQLTLTRLRNDLVANVTHELKTPLASMRLLVDTLLDSDKLDEKTAREYLQLVARENARLSRLIDNFLAFSRMERNKRTFDFEDVPAEKVVIEASAAVRERFEAPGCSFTLHIPEHLPSVTADTDALVTALVNLLDNAYKYSGDQKRITLSALAENGRVSFSVEDNGIGIAPRETKRIFKRFYQVDQRVSRGGGGCGLGLSIVKFIISAHHGEMRVESHPGQGSKFTIILPAAQGAPAP